LALGLVVAFFLTTGAAQESRQPYFRLRDHAGGYEGPGREIADPEDVDEVRIGFFGPDDLSSFPGGSFWAGARLAFEEANAQGGYRGKPFRLISYWSNDPWTAGAGALARAVYREGLWAILGGIDGPTTHLAEQLAAKSRIPVVSPGNTDKTSHLANVPWLFSVLPSDPTMAHAMVRLIIEHWGDRRPTLASATDHDSQMLAVEIRKALQERKAGLRYHLQFKRKTADFPQIAEAIVDSGAATVIVIGSADDSAHLVQQLRRAGYAGRIVLGPSAGQVSFRSLADEAREGIVFPLLWEPDESDADFIRLFNSRFGFEPDYAAAHAYDAARLIVHAIRQAGLNRARIGDALRELSPWNGVTGEVRWDRTGANQRTCALGQWTGGRIRRIDLP